MIGVTRELQPSTAQEILGNPALDSEKVLFNRNVAAAGKQGHGELLVVVGMTPPAPPWQLFHGAHYQRC